MMQRPKCDFSGNLGTTGSPKSRKTYGIGGLVRSLGTKRSSSSSTFSALTCGSLEELVNLNKKNKQLINDKLIHIVANPETLILAYESIKNNSENNTLGVDVQTLDRIDLKWVQNTSKLLLAGKYKFKATRFVSVPKKNKNKKRPLIINSFRDKVVQQAMYLVLNAIYEPSFLKTSHSSRPGKGNHTALKSIKLKFRGVKWCIKSVIESNFSSISHKTLLSLLKKRISCEKFLALIKRSIKTSFVENRILKKSSKKLFQKNITSSLLNNIYLHELDVFMNALCNEFTTSKIRKNSRFCRNISYEIKKTTEVEKEKKFRGKLWQVQSKDLINSNFKKLFYVRYANDFVIGVIGSKEDAIGIKKKVKCFLKKNLKLILSDEKSLITHFSKTPITFLGTQIKGSGEKRVDSISKLKISKKARITNRPILKAPIQDLFLNLLLLFFLFVCFFNHNYSDILQL